MEKDFCFKLCTPNSVKLSLPWLGVMPVSTSLLTCSFQLLHVHIQIPSVVSRETELLVSRQISNPNLMCLTSACSPLCFPGGAGATSGVVHHLHWAFLSLGDKSYCPGQQKAALQTGTKVQPHSLCFLWKKLCLNLCGSIAWDKQQELVGTEGAELWLPQRAIPAPP